jgi:hypothetical protein
MSAIEPSFVEVYQPANHAELALLRPVPDSAGIRYFVKNEFASIGARVATGGDTLGLMVAIEDVSSARAIIGEFR